MKSAIIAFRISLASIAACNARDLLLALLLSAILSVYVGRRTNINLGAGTCFFWATALVVGNKNIAGSKTAENSIRIFIPVKIQIPHRKGEGFLCYLSNVIVAVAETNPCSGLLS